MLKALLLFYLRLVWDGIRWHRHYEPAADPYHFHRRRFTRKYRRKQSIVKNLWITAGLIMLSFPLLPLIAGLGLFTTFLSFVILDETP